ncbi:MAG: Vitamin K epoxide reductase [Sphingobacteriales bacterium]|uniref:vitamin K epoxide reductase family protein n=1 Tax=Hydrotalea flava TaxID=714549 RepID=UPI00082CB484|nr:vitamin K epoxide reductase family protein [Hydrotalea flava]RTL55512.1 MAG: Vitamin K epoxide reductase [Sphingobacteriales bacterium]
MVYSFNTSLDAVAIKYAKLKGVQITASQIKESLLEHPFYPSLLSLSDTFAKFNLKNAAFKIETTQIETIETPFIAFHQVENVGKDFILVQDINKNNVTFYHNRLSKKTISREQFLESFQKIVWLAENAAQKNNQQYKVYKKEELFTRLKQWVAIIAAFMVISGLIVLNQQISFNSYIPYIAIVCVKLMGILATSLLLIYEIDQNNPFIKNLCGIGKKTNCNAILHSKASKIAGVSWSELGFIYFASTCIILLLPGLGLDNKFAFISLLSACASPYIIFSIYYQWKVIKQWCPLCLIVQLTLLLELIWSVSHVALFTKISILNIVNTNFLVVVSIAVILPIIFLFFFKPIFLDAKKYSLYFHAYRRTHFNPDIFNALLVQQPAAPDGWQNIGISIGNPEGKINIIKVCNPYCNPCSEAHPILEELIHSNKNIQVKIIFLCSSKGEMVVNHLMGIYAEGNELKTRNALDAWYLSVEKDYEQFSQKFSVNPSLKDQQQEVNTMNKWVREAGIAFTPTLFINGYRLPEDYSIEDLKNIII